MTGKDRVLKSLAHEKVDRPAWVPYAGVHAGKLVGYDATEVLTDGEKLYEALVAVKKLYVPDGMPITFDLQIEAEILGCDMIWAKDNPPSVTTHPLAKTDEIPDRVIQPDEGRIPLIIDAAKRIVKEFGDDTAIYGLRRGRRRLQHDGGRFGTSAGQHTFDRHRHKRRDGPQGRRSTDLLLDGGGSRF